MSTEVSITNNDENTINLEITAYKNEADIEFSESYDASINVHDIDIEAHSNLIQDIKGDIEEIGIELTTINTQKANKSDVSASLTLKVDAISGKVLSTNDLTTTLKTNYDTAYTNNHIHNNKASLDLLSGTNTGDQNLSNLASTSLSNITATGRTAVSNLGMQSASYIDLTLGASGSTYTAPANGYVCFSKYSTATAQQLQLYSGTIYLFLVASGTGQIIGGYVPCKKGDIIQYYYTTAGTTNSFRFIYAEGSKP